MKHKRRPRPSPRRLMMPSWKSLPSTEAAVIEVIAGELIEKLADYYPDALTWAGAGAEVSFANFLPAEEHAKIGVFTRFLAHRRPGWILFLGDESQLDLNRLHHYTGHGWTERRFDDIDQLVDAYRRAYGPPRSRPRYDFK